MFNTARMYKDGKGIEGDKIYAYMWFDFSHQAGYELAKQQYDKLSTKMSSDEITRARLFSKIFVKQLS